jgi:hypothetical protein
MLLLLLTLGCGQGTNLGGDWRGSMACGQSEYDLKWGPVEKIGGIWQGAGSLDYGDSDLGERVLDFELEVEVIKGEPSATMYDCELTYAGEPETAPCLSVELTYDSDEADFIDGVIDGCVLELER